MIIDIHCHYTTVPRGHHAFREAQIAALARGDGRPPAYPAIGDDEIRASIKVNQLLGAVRGVDPETGHPFDDTRRYIDALALPAAHKQQVFELNARRVYPRLDARLKARGL